MAGSARNGGVVIVGAGHAGGRTAERLRHRGYVGPIDVVGLEPELPYERPPLSKHVLTSPSLPSNAHLMPRARWNELDVRFHLGTEARRIDRPNKSVSLSNGDELSYRRLVLATGLSPRRLPGLEAVSDRVSCLRSYAEALALRDRVAPSLSLLIIGAGLIGLEVASSAVKRGAAVTVVEAAERPLSRLLPPHLSRWLEEVHRQAGVRILCGRRIVEASRRAGRARVVLDDGAHLDVDLILVGIGGVPNDALAAEAGLDVSDGIVVNEYCQTSDPVIFAVGDVARHYNPFFETHWRLESWKNAEDQADVAASYICGDLAPYAEVPWFWTDQYDLNIQVAGMPGAGAPAWERGRIGERGYLAYFASGGRLRGAVGIGCGRDIRLARETIRTGGRLDIDDLRARGFASRDPAGALERQPS